LTKFHGNILNLKENTVDL